MQCCFLKYHQQDINYKNRRPKSLFLPQGCSLLKQCFQGPRSLRAELQLHRVTLKRRDWDTEEIGTNYMLLFTLISFASAYFPIRSLQVSTPKTFLLANSGFKASAPCEVGGFDAMRCGKQTKPRRDVLCQHSKNSVWISQLTCLQKNFHKVVLEEEKSPAEPLGRMWPKSGFPKEGPSEP